MWPIVLGASTLAGAGLGGLLYACSVPSSQVFGPALVRGPAEGRRVALTFDDGPASPFTEQILDILRDRKVTATFFVCGKNVDRLPGVVRRIHEEGHAIGNHTYNHPRLFSCSPAEMAQEIDRTGEAIERITGSRPRIFRPPYGIRWFGLYPVLRERGMALIQWSGTGYDWKYKTDGIIRSSLNGSSPGSVLLLHDGNGTRRPDAVDRSMTVKALPAILDGFAESGLTPVPVNDFLQENDQLFNFAPQPPGF